MRGPYSLDTWTISSNVPRSTPGVYILSRDGKTAHYVGRSDIDLSGRLNQHANANNRYTHFWFEAASSANLAFKLECQWWHKYSPDDNKIHPDRLSNYSWRCPICTIFI